MSTAAPPASSTGANSVPPNQPLPDNSGYYLHLLSNVHTRFPLSLLISITLATLILSFVLLPAVGGIVNVSIIDGFQCIQ
jgi:hypothetical protein